MFTLTGQDKHGIMVNSQMNKRRIRRLTPLECERLMGLPDLWTKYGTDENGKVFEISDSQRYKICGNGVVTNVVTEIMRRLVKEQKKEYSAILVKPPVIKKSLF